MHTDDYILRGNQLIKKANDGELGIDPSALREGLKNYQRFRGISRLNLQMGVILLFIAIGCAVFIISSDEPNFGIILLMGVGIFLGYFWRVNKSAKAFMETVDREMPRDK